MVRKETEVSEVMPKKFPITEAVWASLGKNKMQLLFLMIFLILCPFLALFLREFNNIYQMRKAQRPDYDWPLYSDLYIALSFSAALTVTLVIWQKLLTSTASSFLVSVRYQGSERTERAERMVKSLFKGVYFTLSVGFAYYISKDSFFMPASLGGNGNIDEVFKDTPFYDKSSVLYMKEFFMVQLGYHFHSLIVHLFSKIRNDFMEMLLHHSITVMLISLGYLTNYIPMAFLILYCHDISDAFVSYSRFFVDTDYKKITAVCTFLLIVSWFYTRLIILPFELIRISCYNNPMMHEMHGIEIIGAMVHILVVLHVYWFVLLVKMGLRFIKTSILEDSQQDLSHSH